MTTARTASIRSLWTALQGAPPLYSLSLRSDESAAAVRERIARRLRLRSAMAGWRIEDRSQGPVLRFSASERAPLAWLGRSIEVRGEITPRGTGCALEAAFFDSGRRRWRPVGPGDLLAIAALGAVAGAFGAASAQDHAIYCVLTWVPSVTLVSDVMRRLRTERSVRALGDWVTQALAPGAGVGKTG